MSFKQKVSVVTGGSRGIGKAIALALARKGSKVVICARNITELSKTATDISTAGGDCSYVCIDITEEEQVNLLAKRVLKEHAKIDILVNSAGVGKYASIIATSCNEWDKIIDTNLKGTFLCSKIFARSMVKQRSGCIVTIASRAGKRGMKNLGAYCASKFGVVGLTESMREELKDFGIEVLCVFPSYVRTEFFKDFHPNFTLPRSALEPEEVAEQVLRMINDRSKLREIGARIFHRKAF